MCLTPNIQLSILMISSDRKLVNLLVEQLLKKLPKERGRIVLGDFALRETNRDRGERAYQLKIANHKPEPRFQPWLGVESEVI